MTIHFLIKKNIENSWKHAKHCKFPRVQRKSFLKLAIQASWSWHVLPQTSFQLAPKTFEWAELIL